MIINTGMIGSRHYKHLDNIPKVIDWLSNVLSYAELNYFSGGASGVDTKVRITCREKGKSFTECKPDFSDGYDVKQFFIRNDLIVNKVNILIAFWDGESKGTSYTFNRARRLNKTVLVILDEPVEVEKLTLVY